MHPAVMETALWCGFAGNLCKEKTLKSSLCTVSVLGVDEPFHLLDQESIQNVIDTFEKVPEEEEDAGEGGSGDQDVAPMET
uniref:Uncharacterized protein n=1 Tax=Brassica oleracea var. oleracea TaxID=109376 RepID=A0A0D3CNW2_BRAOL